MSELLAHSLCEIAGLLARRALSPVELMRASLARIAEANPALGAFVALREEQALLAEARRAEERIGAGRGRPLEGIPFGVKDLEDLAGLVTSHGSLLFRENRAERSSVQVERLLAAGAIAVGKTNAPEFGYTAITKNLLFGVTRNPWDLERTPGGSSGGSSAAIAAGLVPLATASDGGGSIRLPASFTGCFGLKPSFGRVPHEDASLWVMDDTSVVGPLTRSVEDAALQLDLTAGAHPLDPNSLPHPGISYRAALRDLPAGLRIAFSPDLGYAVVQRDVAPVVARAARVFEELGHCVEELRGGPPELGAEWGIVGAFELLSRLAPLLPEREAELGRAFRRGLEFGRHVTPELWGRMRRRREELNRWCAELFARYDLLLTPTAPFDPPPAKGPLPLETEGRAQPVAGAGSFTIPFNLSWHPAASLRAGFSEAGLPVGLQIVGPRHRDDLVLQAAFAFEQARPWRDHWPRVGGTGLKP
jgi:aspartyl-tRNA(Asn)/glutamyl-tRNA(Gln) amidotransferase subunit A